MMMLRDLLEGFISNIDMIPSVSVNGLSLDSREIKKGDLFFAYPGVSCDRRKFIPQVIQDGAAAVLKESEIKEEKVVWEGDVPIISCPDIAKKVTYIAGKFYNHPSREMNIIGVTGTNGKTSCSYLLTQALELLGQKAGVIGSIGYGFLDTLDESSTLTTLDPITVQAILRNLLDQKTKSVSMEVTSHALHQGRVAGIDIDIGVFTNLGRDHFDYHVDEAGYARAKHMLFEMPGIKHGIFNIDDRFGLEWIKECQNKFSVCGFSMDPKKQYYDFPVIVADDVRLNLDKIEAKIISPWGEGNIEAHLLGRFNIANLLVVIAALGFLKYPLKDILQVLPKLKPIRGRMQALGGGDKPLVIVDNSHKPEALRTVLMALREHCQGRLICLVGCGGNRDRGKRPIMSAIAEELSDHVVVSCDNPRLEEPQSIINDMMEGISKPEEVDVEPDRRLAVELAVSRAKAGDILLLAGKGHEPYHIIGEVKTPFSEEKIVKELLSLE